MPQSRSNGIKKLSLPYKISLGIIAFSVLLAIFSFFIPEKTASPPPPTFSDNLNNTDRDTALKAYAILRKECSSLFSKFSSDIAAVEINVMRIGADDCQFDYLCREYSWRTIVEIKPKIKDRPTSIPADFRAFGHTLYYSLGGGNAAGIVSWKDPSQLVCGWEPGHGSAVFKGVPALDFM